MLAGRAFIILQMPMFIQNGLITEQDGHAFVEDIETLNAANAFSASFIAQAATGTTAVA